MPTAIAELDRNARHHRAGACGLPSRPRNSARAGAAERQRPARRPAPPATSGARAATRMPSHARPSWRAGVALLVIVLALTMVFATTVLPDGPARAFGAAQDALALSTPGQGAGASRASGALAAGSSFVVVGEGETVWDLVAPHVPAGEGLDDYVALVLEHNGLKATTLRPGTLVRLP